MTLYMLHLPIHPRALMACARGHGHADDRQAAELGYLVHGLFDRLAAISPKPFEIQADWRRAASGHGHETPPISVFAYAACDHHAYRAAAHGSGDAQALGAVAWDKVGSKAMPSLQPGQRLGFRLRASPTVRIGKRHPRLEPGSEVDPYHALMQRRLGERLAATPGAGLKAMTRSVKDDMPDRETVYRDWLGARLGGAATLVSAQLVAQRDAALWRRGEPRSEPARTMYGQPRPEHRGRRLIGRREIVFEGVLDVADREVFAALLARGVGRHRAFGFGMLLLRAAPG